MMKVLLVDDDKVLVMMMEKLLSAMDISSFLAYSGNEAIRIISDKFEEIDVVVTDCCMSEGSGMDVVYFLNKMRKQKVIPAIMLTGLDEVNKEESKVCNIFAYFVKPVPRMTEFLATLSDAFDYAKRENYMLKHGECNEL